MQNFTIVGFGCLSGSFGQAGAGGGESSGGEGRIFSSLSWDFAWSSFI